MRKSLWIILAVLFVAIGAPYAHADALVYTYTVTFDPPLFGATFTTKPIQAVTAPNAILTATDLTSFSLTGSFYLGTFDEFILNYGGAGAQGILTSNGLGAGSTVSLIDEFTLIDYSTPGTYSSGNATLSVSRVPEPATLDLMLAGVGLLGLLTVMRKL